jgi:hypothetical protein
LVDALSPARAEADRPRQDADLREQLQTANGDRHDDRHNARPG